MRLHRSEARWGEDRTDEDRSRSAWSPHSYVNISYLQECYESRVLSRHMSAQIRAIAILRHKGEFAYESSMPSAARADSYAEHKTKIYYKVSNGFFVV